MNRLTQYYEAPDPADSRYLASEELKEESKNQCSGLGNRVGNSIEKVFNKLGMLEDIEEELGCPLEVLFKALKTTVFTNAEDCYGQELPSGLREFEVRLNVKNMSLGLIHNSMFKGKEVIRHIPLKDYKKTWWLKEDKSE